jgi:hypothetical protein
VASWNSCFRILRLVALRTLSHHLLKENQKDDLAWWYAGAWRHDRGSPNDRLKRDVSHLRPEDPSPSDILDASFNFIRAAGAGPDHPVVKSLT